MERAPCIKNEVTQKESVQLFTTQKKQKTKQRIIYLETLFMVQGLGRATRAHPQFNSTIFV